jgi:hypothetical protein
MQEKTFIIWMHKKMSIDKWTPNTSSSDIRLPQIMDMLIKASEKSGGNDPRKDYRKIEVTLKEVEDI